MNLLKKFPIFFRACIGYVKKTNYDIRPISVYCPLDSTEDRLIVTLTSYGRRVQKTVYYTLLSLLNQSIRPNRIILWLDEQNWDDNKLPNKLKKLREKGVEIRYCKDLLSYKKLLPALDAFPKAILITVDDDVMYEPEFIEKLYSAYIEEPSKIHCTTAAIPAFYSDGNFKAYREWERIPNEKDQSGFIMPIGEGGILYPPGALHRDTINYKLASELCPKADDIWFWLMARRNGTKHNKIKFKRPFYSFDAIYQYFHKGSALTHENSKKNHNDLQLENMVKYFDIRFNS